MELIRKFYMADPNGGTGSQKGPTGPNAQDVDNAEDLEEIFLRMQNTLRSIAVILKDTISDELENMDSVSQRIAKNLGKELEAELKKSAAQTRIIRSNEVDIAKGLVSSKSIRQEINKVQRQQAQVTSLIKQLELEQNTLSNKQKRLQEDILAELQQQLNILENQEAAAKRMESKMESLTGVLKGLAAIPILGQFVKAEKVLEKVKETAAEGGSKMQIFAAGADAFIGGIASGLTGLIMPALIGIYKAVEQFDQKAFDIAKNLGVTVSEAKDIQSTFTQIAATSANAGLTGKDIAKTYIELSNTIGFLLPQNKEFAETATLIEKRIGASAANMEALTLQSTLSGKTLEETMGTLNASRNIEGARSKLLLSQKQILDGIAKTSAAVLINFKGDVGALGDAIVRATKLGTTLDTINKQGESLLDFESSISAEFEAQLLTGRDINLTRARELALYGKTAELGEELNRQGATYQQFMNENIIARQADAKAIGLSVEEYSKILLQQQQAKRLGAEQGQSAKDKYNQLVKDGATQEEIISKLGSKQEAEDLRKASMQEKFQAAIEKLKDTLGAVLQGPVGDLANKFAAFVGDQEKMNKLANTLKSIFGFIGKVIERFPQILSASIGIMKILVGLSVARAVASIVGSLSTIPVVGPAAGLLAGALAMGWLTSLTSGSPSSPPNVSTPTAPTEAGTAPPLNSTTASGDGIGKDGTKKEPERALSFMTKPINPATAAATAAATTSDTAANAQSLNSNTAINLKVELDGQPLYSNVKNRMEQDQGLKKR